MIRPRARSGVARLCIAALVLASQGCDEDQISDSDAAAPDIAPSTTTGVSPSRIATTAPSTAPPPESTAPLPKSTASIPEEMQPGTPARLAVEEVLGPPDVGLVIRLPNDSVRGVMWFLDRREHDGTWTQMYALNTNREGAPQRTYRLGVEPYVAPDLAVRGRGPDRLEFPADLDAGRWRACPAGAEMGCVQFESVSNEAGPEIVLGANPYLPDGRSFVATTERVDDEVNVGFELPIGSNVSTARVDELNDGVWEPVMNVAPVNDNGGLVVATGDATVAPLRLCLVQRPAEVACVLLPE
ncbi:MAG TPA: hypothetical protein VMM60_07190 [Ilumatobacter sp.]|nr:hypothetical protein [Ilumatobacter sp.]